MIVMIILIFASPAHITAQTTADIQLVATTTIVADAVRQVVGNLATVTAVIPIGADPHEYTATPSNVETITNAQHLFFLGAEESLSYLTTNLENQGRATNLIEYINESQLIVGSGETADIHGHQFNPHYWMNPLLWRQAVQSINETLAALYPEHAATFSQNTANYLQQLDDLDAYIRLQVGQLSADQRFIITQHQSMIYYSQQYNFTTATLQGVSTESQSSIQNVDELANFIIEHKIPVVFSEDSTDPNNLEAVLDSVRAQGQTAVVAGQLLVASLGKAAGTDTYIGLLKYDTNLITQSWLNPPEDTVSVLDNSLLGFFGLLGFGLGIIVNNRRRNQ